MVADATLLDPASAQEQLLVNRYLALVGFTLLYYDHLLTIASERARYWTRPLTWPAAFFFANRYLAACGQLPIIFQLFWYGPVERCHALGLYHQFFAVVCQLLVGILLIFRTYALYGRARWVLCFLIALAIVVVSTGIWSISRASGQAIRQASFGCQSGLSQDDAIHLCIAWTGLLVFDTAIFGLTLFQALSAPRHRTHQTLFHVLLRDGTIYFAALAVANLLNILSFLLAPALLKGTLTTFTNALSTTLICRLMLNVRAPHLSRALLASSASSASARTPRARGAWGSDGSSAGAYVSTIVDVADRTGALSRALEGADRNAWVPDRDAWADERGREIELEERGARAKRAG